MSGIRKRTAAIAAAGLMTLGGVVAVAGPASAEGSQDCTGNSGGLCIYYNSNERGARADLLGDVWNYAVNPDSWECNGAAGCPPYLFSWGGSSGYGWAVKNNAASACLDTQNIGPNGNFYRVYYNSGYNGHFDTVGPSQQCTNFVQVKNNNASQQEF